MIGVQVSDKDSINLPKPDSGFGKLTRCAIAGTNEVDVTSGQEYPRWLRSLGM